MNLGYFCNFKKSAQRKQSPNLVILIRHNGPDLFLTIIPRIYFDFRAV
jgi:hypothetical protein